MKTLKNHLTAGLIATAMLAGISSAPVCRADAETTLAIVSAVAQSLAQAAQAMQPVQMPVTPSYGTVSGFQPFPAVTATVSDDTSGRMERIRAAEMRSRHNLENIEHDSNDISYRNLPLSNYRWVETGR